MPVPDLENPQMSAAERDRLAAELKRTRRYFEFGMGGSSLMAVRAGVREMVCIDSDPQWVEAVRSHPEIAPRAADCSVAILHADIGAVADWGRPADRSGLRKWSAYLSAGWAEWARRDAMPDLVFVDGRFRVACCLSVAVVCARLADDAYPRLMMHDVDDRRAYYRDALEMFDEVETVDTLLVLRPRRDRSPAFALSRLLERQFDFT